MGLIQFGLISHSNKNQLSLISLIKAVKLNTHRHLQVTRHYRNYSTKNANSGYIHITVCKNNFLTN